MKQLLGLTIILLVSLQSISQTSQSRDSTVISIKDLRKAALLIEQGKVAWDKYQAERKLSALLDKRIELKDSSIQCYEDRLATYGQMIDNYIATNYLNKKEIAIYQQSLFDAKKAIKKQKAKTWLVAILGGAAVSYLIFK